MNTIENIYQLFIEYPHISTDSRKIEKNSLFFALKGDNFNGNKFAEAALEKGAAYAIIDENKYKTSEKTILVNDVLITLQELAKLHRKKLAIPILAITGTNGKTTTKELVSAVLSQKFNIGFTLGNLNNHIGVPLTLLKMDAETEFGVVEMGANHPGEIAELCSIADPDYGIITNIGKAHLEGFGSFEGVIKTKSELYSYLKKKSGAIFFNQDNPILNNLVKDIDNKISYGVKNANFTGEPLQSPPFVHIKAHFEKGILYLNSRLTGDFNFENIIAAACIGNYFKIDPLKIQKGIKEYEPKNNRSQIINKGNYKINMDAYNANPTSMHASIKSFLNNVSGTNCLILGDMLELGVHSQEEHLSVLNLLKNYPTTKVFLVGKFFSGIANQFNCQAFPQVEKLCDYLQQNKINQKEILIKGSRGIQLEKVLDCL